jgi:hypothetical protein
MQWRDTIWLTQIMPSVLKNNTTSADVEIGQPYLIKRADGYSMFGIQEIIVIAKSPSGEYINVLTTNDGDAVHTHDWHLADHFLDTYTVLSEIHPTQSALFPTYWNIRAAMTQSAALWMSEHEHTPA